LGGTRSAVLMVQGVFYVFGAVSDLTSDASAGLPTDHTGTFTALSGTSYPNTQGSTPGTTHYITLLEHGYARHELTFTLLFLVLLAIHFRRRQRWAWWAAWMLVNDSSGRLTPLPAPASEGAGAVGRAQPGRAVIAPYPCAQVVPAARAVAAGGHVEQ